MLKSLKKTLVAAALALALPLAPATAKPELTVYTYDSFTAEWGPGPAIKKAFEAECGCVLNWVSLDSSLGILSRLQLEGDSTKADVALGLDLNTLETAKATGLFAPHQANTSNLDLPIFWQDDIFLPFDYGYFAFIYDRDRLTVPPRSLRELVNAPDDLKIIIQDPRTSTPGLGLMLWVRQVYGEEAPKAWAKLAPKLVTVTKGWYEGYSMFLKGEADMVLSYTTSPAYHMIAEDQHKYLAADFAEGHYMQVEVAARTKASKNPELANRFLSFMMSQGFQSTIPTGNWMYPVVKLKDGLPKAFGKLVQPKTTLLLDPEQVRVNRKAWTGEWLDGVSR